MKNAPKSPKHRKEDAPPPRPEPPMASAFDLALLAAVLALGKTEKQRSWGPQEFLGSAEQLLGAAALHIASGGEPLSEKSFHLSMGWANYTVKQIAKDNLIGIGAGEAKGERKECTERWVRKLIQRAFPGEHKHLLKTGLSHSELQTLKEFCRHSRQKERDRKRQPKK